MSNLFFLAEDIDADSLLSLCSMKSVTVLELDGLFSLCSSTFNSYVSLDFYLEKNAWIFLVFFASKHSSFYCSFANYGTFLLVNKDTTVKIYMPEDTVSYHDFVSIKALNTECWEPVLFVSYRERVRKIPHKNE